MKIQILVLYLAFAAKSFCNWPAETLIASVIAKNPSPVSAPLLKGVSEISLSASDYRSVTLSLDPHKNQILCSFPIAYYESSSWLSGGYADNKINGWSQRPNKGLKNYHSDVGSLIGILDQNSIKFNRSSITRIDQESKDVRAIWNTIEFSVPLDKIHNLNTFMSEYYRDYKSDTEISIYLTHNPKPVKSEPADPKQFDKANVPANGQSSAPASNSIPQK